MGGIAPPVCAYDEARTALAAPSPTPALALAAPPVQVEAAPVPWSFQDRTACPLLALCARSQKAASAGGALLALALSTVYSD